jgi:hypothetical protein
MILLDYIGNIYVFSYENISAIDGSFYFETHSLEAS